MTTGITPYPPFPVVACGLAAGVRSCHFRNLSILQKIGLVVFVMGLSSLVIALVGARGIISLEGALVSVGAKEEVAREAMDLRVDVIAISRMTYQLAAKPEKAADFRAETEKRSTKCWSACRRSSRPRTKQS